MSRHDLSLVFQGVIAPLRLGSNILLADGRSQTLPLLVPHLNEYSVSIPRRLR